MGKYNVRDDGRIFEDEKPIGWISNANIELDEGIEVSAAAMNYLKAQAFDRLQAQPQAKTLVEVFSQEHSAQAMQPHASEIPPAPAQDPYMGDKTPAYVHWYKLYHSEADYNAKYLGRRMPAGEHRPERLGPDVSEKSMPEEPKEEWK